MWNKKFEKTDRKKFLHLIDYIIEAIDSGGLEPGQSLPTQRELSKKLNLSIGTITKAFKELEKMGYLSGEIGRGTFVKDISSEYADFWYSENKVPYKYNLGHYRTTELFNHTIQTNLLSSIKEVTNRPDLYLHLNDLNNCGSSEQKHFFIDWIQQIGFKEIKENQISLLSAQLLTSTLLINTLTNRNDSIILEEIGDRITKDQIIENQRSVVTVKIDEKGIIPADLERAIKKDKPSLLITTPTFHNPTGLITPLKRKKEILTICEKYGVKILEDGKVDFFASENVHPYYVMNPEIGIYSSGLYFTINPSLTISFVVASNEIIKKLESNFKLSYWNSSQLLLEISTSLIKSSRADKIISERKKLLQVRNGILNGVFEDKGHPNSVLRWVRIPEGRSSSELTQIAFENGILIRNSDIFAIDSNLRPPFVRICNATIHKDDQYKKALIELKSIFDEIPVEF